MVSISITNKSVLLYDIGTDLCDDICLRPDWWASFRIADLAQSSRKRFIVRIISSSYSYEIHYRLVSHISVALNLMI